MELFEGILCHEAWLSQPTHWKLTNTNKAKKAAMKSVRKLMFMCVKRLHREKGNGWRIPKFHEWLHFVEDMSRFGAAPNFCAQRPESLLKDVWPKNQVHMHRNAVRVFCLKSNQHIVLLNGLQSQLYMTKLEHQLYLTTLRCPTNQRTL